MAEINSVPARAVGASAEGSFIALPGNAAMLNTPLLASHTSFSSQPLTFDLPGGPLPSSQLAITALDASKREGNSGSTPFTFLITRTNATNRESDVFWTVIRTGSNPVNDADFTNRNLLSDVIVFAKGETARTITVQVAGDYLIEPDETFHVSLFPLAADTISVGSAQATILNDDDAISESVGKWQQALNQIAWNNITVADLILGAQRTPTSYSLFLPFHDNSTGSLRLVGTGFQYDGQGLPIAGTVSQASISKGSSLLVDNRFLPTDITAIFNVVIGDLVDDRRIGSPTLGFLRAKLDIRPVLSITSLAANQAEGNGGPTLFTYSVLRRDGDISGSSSVRWAVSGPPGSSNAANAADFSGGTFHSGTLSFAAGETAKTLTVSVNGDTAVEANETFRLTLSSATGATLSTTAAVATATISNDDSLLAIAPLAASKAEGNSGSTPFTFRITRSGSTAGTSTAVWATTGTGANAANAADFFSGTFPSGTVSFAAGQTSRTLTIPIAGDTVFEPNESFRVSLFTPSVGTSLSASAASASGTLTNDDPLPVLRVSASNSSQSEGNSGLTSYAFVVSRSGGDISGSSSVRWAVSGPPGSSNAANAADFSGGTFHSGTLSFAAGETAKTLTVSVNGDTAVEANETFRLTLSSATGATLSTTAAVATATISNDDSLLAIAPLAASKAEGRPTTFTPLTFTITRTGNTSLGSTALWQVDGSGSNAANAADFRDGVLPSGTLSFAAGQTSRTLTLSVAGDSVFEANETFRLSLSNPSNGTSIQPAAASATGIINNDDPAPILGVRASAGSLGEGSSGTTPYAFLLSRTGNTTGPSTVRWDVVGTGPNPTTAGDFAGATFGSLAFAAGETAKTLTLLINGDSEVEANESFRLTLSAATGAILDTAKSVARGTIVNDDLLLPSSLSISALETLKPEGSSGITPFGFRISREGSASGTSTALWSTSREGTTPADASDFAGNALPFGTVSFAAGQTVQTITALINADQTIEADESFRVTLSTPSAGTVLGTASATATVGNDDFSITLYDPRQTTLPSQQGWLTYVRGLSASETRSANGTTLDSSALLVDAGGYLNHTPGSTPSLINSAFPRLNRSVGFALDFRLQVSKEDHQSDGRAGFSVILLDQGPTPQGIELDFWKTSIFSQKGGNPPFQGIAERTSSDVKTSEATNYGLRMLDHRYVLMANNRLVLSGSVQDYSQWAKDPLLPFNPYSTPNFLFLGDATRRASATVELGTISLAVARTGSGNADTLMGSAAADSLNGMAGADQLGGGAGNDWLAGGVGSDTLQGGEGDDLLMGGSDADSFLFASEGLFNSSQLGVDTIVDFNPSEDRLRLDRATFAALPAGPSLAETAFAVVDNNAAAASSGARIVYNSANGGLFYNPNGNAAGFADSTGGGGQFAQLSGSSSAAPVPTITSSVFAIL